MKYFCILILFSVAVFTRLDRYFFKTNDSFCPKFISPIWSRCPQYENEGGLDPNILNQDFYYLCKGEQSFVFLSADQKWVVKFPRLPKSVRSPFRKFRHAIKFEDFLKNGHAVCEELGEETGMVFAHLKPSMGLGHIRLIDRYGEMYILPLGRFPFFVQKYGENYFSALKRLKDPRVLIQRTIDLFNRLYDKGFIDRDPILDKNFGALGEIPFIIDTGQLEKCETLPKREEYLHQMLESLEGYLKRESPSLYEFYRNCLLL